ncbi:hypothetical protein [Xanthobacter versatilis]|uniref:hypothetical protein n=1 Tax=Xanthobacter autotrophicus (strain ATCC BAA-1158 / Py2) TaxID=78245 RepID=UPI00372BD357
MRIATPSFKFDIRDVLGRARRLASASLGDISLNLPFVSVAVNPKDKEKHVARELVIRLKDRRVLTAWECCDGCIDQAPASLQETRRLLVDKQVELADMQDGPLYMLVDAMALGIRQFLIFEQRLNAPGAPPADPCEFWRRQDTRHAYFDALEILRGHLSRCLGQIATLAGMEPPNEGIIVHYQGAWQLEADQEPQAADEGDR